MDVQGVATAVVAALVPYLPRLVQAGQETAETAVKIVVQEGGKVAWGQAQKIWQKIKGRFGDDTELDSTAQLAAAKPEQDTYKSLFAEVLAARLQQDEALAEELMMLLGGQEAVQEIVAEQGSWVENVTQEMEGPGRQTLRATDDSVISGVKQSKK